MSVTRRRSDRPGLALRRGWSRLEELEGRQLLSGSNYSYYNPDLLPNSVRPGNVPTPVLLHPIGIGDQTLASLGTEGKSVSGRDRNGNTYTITVYGPGEVIVSDVTPNDGVLDDDIATIQLVGTNPNTTHVIGQVVASDSTLTDQSTPTNSLQEVVSSSGNVLFNQLISQNGVASIVLNGFVLTQTQTPLSGIPNSATGIFLPGGVRNLSFSGIMGLFDTSQAPAPIDVTIGDPNIPLRFKPTIRIDSIQNTVFNTTSSTPGTTPVTTPTVALIVNGTIHSLQLGYVSQATEPGAQQFFFPTVAATGRTSVQTKGIDNLVVSGDAINFTVSQTPQPYTSPTSGVAQIGSAIFGGNADALALDVAGRIGFLEFARGLGSPVGFNLTATQSGTPVNQYGYPANGLLGGLVTASSIGQIVAAPADVTMLTSNNPANIQSLPGFTKYYGKAGKTLNFAAIATTGNIGSTNIVGDSTQSEVKTGYIIQSAIAGNPAIVGASRINKIRVRGDLVDTAISASYQPSATGYGTKGSVAGPGSITGTIDGNVYNVGNITALGNLGSGFFAKFKSPGLP
jgi:hypothetical protein